MAEKTQMNRHDSRKTVFTLLYTKEFYKELDGREFLQASAEAAEVTYNVYIVSTFLGAVAHQAEIDHEIETYAVKWKVSRMAKVTRSILRLAIYEMLYAEVPVPPKVLINEAVELAKEYDDDAAPTFINGILHRVAHEHGLLDGQTRTEEQGMSGITVDAAPAGITVDTTPAGITVDAGSAGITVDTTPDEATEPAPAELASEEPENL